MAQWKRFLIDASVLAALSVCQTWGMHLQQAGNRFRGGWLAVMALVIAFAAGKTLGARRGTAV